MKVHVLTDSEIKELPHVLTGEVFHLSTEKAYSAILRYGGVGHNREARYPLNFGSGNSFGRLHGYVCLYDLRAASPRRLSLTRELCDFMNPNWQMGGRGPVYLILRKEVYSRLVPNASAYHFCRATGRSLKYVPGAECWYPGDLPLTAVSEVLRFRSC